MEDYALYLLTGAVFGAIVAVVYQVKRMALLEKKMLNMEKKILSKISRKKVKK